MLKSISKSRVKQKVCTGGYRGCGGGGGERSDSSEGNGGRGGRLVVMFPIKTVIPSVPPPPLPAPQHWTWGCILQAHYDQFWREEQARGCLVGCLMRLRAATWIHSAALSLVQSLERVGGGWGVSGAQRPDLLWNATGGQHTAESSEAADLLRASLLFLQTDSRDRACWNRRQVRAPTQITSHTSLI